jgi:hypothetical protein
MTHEDRDIMSDLLGFLRDEELTQTQLQQLEEFVLTSEEARWLYIDTVHLRTSLRWANSRDESATKPPKTTVLGSLGFGDRPLQSFLCWPYVVALLGAFVACTAVVIHTGLFQFGSRPDEVSAATPVASISQSFDCQWGKSGQVSDLAAGDKLELLAGMVQVTFAGGTKVNAEGPVALDCVSDKAVFLHRGRLTALVAPKDIGFTVSTPNTRIIDLGTEFGVHVDPSKTSSVAVFRGAVDVECRSPRKTEVAKHRVLADEVLWINDSSDLVQQTGFVDSFKASMMASTKLKTLLMIDVTSDAQAPLEPGFTPFVVASDGTDAFGLPVRRTPAVQTFGDLQVTLRGVGADLCPRNRTHVSYGDNFAQANLLRDLVFASGGDADTTGLDVLIEGLVPGREYIVTLWSSDISSEGTRVSNWKANGVRVKRQYAFTYEVFPKSSEERRFSFSAIADSAGQILMEGRRDASSYISRLGPQPGVYLNGLQVMEKARDATPTAKAKAAPI